MDSQKRLNNAIELLKEGDPELVNFWITYLKTVIYFLDLEEKYPIIKEEGKGIRKYLRIPKFKTHWDVVEYAHRIYNPTHQVRFAVETIFNIEIIRKNESFPQELLKSSSQEKD